MANNSTNREIFNYLTFLFFLLHSTILLAGNHESYASFNPPGGCSGNSSRIGDFVWSDLDRDGVQDANEPGIGGVTVKLFKCSGVFLKKTVTHSDGEYEFLYVEPGNQYFLEFSGLPQGFVFSTKNAGGNSETDSNVNPATGRTDCFLLTPSAPRTGNANPELEFCTYNLEVKYGQTFNIRNYIHYKDHPNWEIDWSNVRLTYTEVGANDPTVPANWRLADFNSGIPVKVTSADAAYGTGNHGTGRYRIYIYRVGQATYDDHMTIRVTGCGSNVVSAKCLVNRLDLDAGAFSPVANPTPPWKGYVGDFVWNDLDGDGVQDAGEPGLPHVWVTIFKDNGVVIGSKETDAEGKYVFENLESGFYRLKFDLQNNFIFSPKNAVADETADSDADATGFTGLFELANDNNFNVDAGFRVLPTCTAYMTPMEDIVLVAPPGQNGMQVIFDSPIGLSECPLGGLNIQQTEGLPSGSFFPVGVSTVVFSAYDACGCAAGSLFSLKIIVSPSNIPAHVSGTETICSGGRSILTANVDPGDVPVAYYWQRDYAGVWVTMATGILSYQTPFLTQTTRFRLLVNHATLGTLIAETVFTVVVVPDPTVRVDGGGVFCPGVFSVLAATLDGGTGDFNFQWQSSMDNVSFENIVGATEQNLIAEVTGSNQFYRVQVIQTGEGCNTLTSEPELLSTIATPEILISGTEKVCKTGSASLQSRYANGNPTNGILIQWQDSPDGQNLWTDIPGANTANFTTPGLTSDKYYRAVYSNPLLPCETGISGAFLVEVVADPVAGIVGADIQICKGGSATFTASVNGGAGTPSYQWQSSRDGLDFLDISGATDVVFNTGGLLETEHFRVAISFSGAGCSPAISAHSELVVADDPSVSIFGPSQICPGQTVVLSANLSGGTAVPTIQWQRRFASLWVPIQGANGTELSVNPSLSTDYKVVFGTTGSGCEQAESNVLQLEMGNAPLILEHPTDAQVPENETLTLSVLATGADLNYQWERSANGNDWAEIPSATSATFTTEPLTEQTFFRVVVVNAFCNERSTSNPARVSISNQNPQAACNRLNFEPANDGFTIRNLDDVAAYDIRVDNLDGQTIFQNTSNEPVNDYQITGLDSGTYNLHVSIFDQHWTLICSRSETLETDSGNQGQNLVTQSKELTFNALREKMEARLSWVSYTAERNAYFVVERSTDGVRFKPTTKIDAVSGPAHEAQIFNHTDKNPQDGDNYYRLRVVFRDGSVLFSEVKKVSFPVAESFSIYPNPAAEFASLDVAEWRGEELSLRVSDRLGRLVFEKTNQKLDSPTVQIEVSNWENGHYFVHLQVAGKRALVRKLVVSKNE